MGMTWRGTTPTKAMVIYGYDLSECKVHVYFRQPPNVLITKEPVISFNGTSSTVICELTQEETLQLNAFLPVEIQVRWISQNGNVDETPIVREKVGDVLNEEVMEYGD